MGAEEALERLVAWADAEPSVRGMLLLGSRARTDTPADEWSDTDVLLFTTDVARWLDDGRWLDAMGEVVVTYTETTALRDLRERRVTFADAADLDIVPVPAERVEEILAVDAALPVLALGYRTLLDKDRLFADLPDRVAAADPWAITDAAPWPPDPAEAANLIGDYWYHCVWITKKLRRGEVWVAQGCLNGYQRRILLRFVEWQAKLRSGGQAQTWFDGRYLERWAAPETVEALRDAFARHDERDVARGLLASVAAFAPLGREVAAGVSIPYPDEAEAWISRWVADRLGEAGLV